METTFKDGRFLGQTLNLERLDLATVERTTLVADAAYPSVSPDGSCIAYITFATGDDPGGLWVARADGSDRRLIVPAAGRFVVITHPRFSPDGSTIAFSAATYASSRNLRPGGPPAASALNAKPISAHGLPQDIWLVQVAGGEPRKLGLGATLAQLDWR